MRTRARIAAAAAVAAIAVALAGVALASGGSVAGDAGDAGELRWAGTPKVFGVKELPDDRILRAELRNESLRPIDVDVARVRVLDAEGRALKSSASFLLAYAHGLYPPDERDPAKTGKDVKRLLGELATFTPGEARTVTISWRGGPATHVDVDGRRLALP